MGELYRCKKCGSNNHMHKCPAMTDNTDLIARLRMRACDKRGERQNYDAQLLTQAADALEVATRRASPVALDPEQSPRLFYVKFVELDGGALYIRKWAARPFEGATAYAHAGNGAPLGPLDRSEHYPVDQLPMALRDVAECLWTECEPHVVEDMVRIVTDAAEALEAATPSERERRLVAALSKCVAVIEAFKNVSNLSEGIHTGLRKGTDASDAHVLWEAISRSRSSAWPDAIEFALDPYFTMWGGDEALSLARTALAEQGEKK